MNFSLSDTLLHVVPSLENPSYQKTLSDITEITREAKISSVEVEHWKYKSDMEHGLWAT